MKLLIAGDFCPVNRAAEQLAEGHSLFAPSFRDFWKNAAFRVANLESPITDSNNAIKKTGPPLKAPTKVGRSLRDLEVNAFSLANNHIMDYGQQGLTDTVQLLKQSDIQFFGVRLGEEEHRTCVVEKDGVSVALLSYTNAEFSLASDYNNFGAFPIEVMRMVEDLEAQKKVADHVVVLLHTGLYNFPLPTPKQIELCKFLIKRGASAVLCQHSHICGAYEYYEGGFISYGQGSFVFDLNKKNSHWNEGYVVALDLDKEKMSASIHGTIQFNATKDVELMNESQQQVLMQKLQRHNEALASPSIYKETLEKFLDKSRQQYFGLMTMPGNRWTRAISRRFNMGKLVPKQLKRVWLNLIRNEEHNEVLQEILKRDLQ